MKKLFGIVFVTFALSLVAGSIISCSQQAPANQGNQTGNTGGNIGGWNASSFAYTKYSSIRKEGGGSETSIIKFVSKEEWTWKVEIPDGTYVEAYRGTYTVEGDKILLKVTWCATTDKSLVGDTLVLTIVNNKQFILLNRVWDKF